MIESPSDPVTINALPGDDSVEPLLRVLPAWVQEAIAEFGPLAVEEVALDLGRSLSLRSRTISQWVPHEVTKADLHFVIHRVHGFREDDRTGIDRTVHRIACIRDRYGFIVGLTIRVGRAVAGRAEVIRDLLDSGHNLLLVGPPGAGKTTLLRDATRILSERWGPRVIVVDTSNEIGGDGRIPHPGIGQARRVQVREPSAQSRILMQTLTNHGPQVLVVDELGFQLDVAAALSIARRGVQMLATAHGCTLADVVNNPDLAPLVGGTDFVGIRRRRLSSPVFCQVVELRDPTHLLVHTDVAHSVDQLCTDQLPSAIELRVCTPDVCERLRRDAIPEIERSVN